MILSEEFAGSWPGSHSRHIESQESVVDDPVEHDDIEEVVELAGTNPKEILTLLAKLGDCSS